ncbi:translocon-associated protein subunit delta [Drosophila grimshawi]|uniref:Translocon-associated protein subunit delta n=1 Tax=Drosophila grimshawi TaxID=7222 RepID=B4J8Z0_DROGR|nr:translocon-associated protein subunit delta [Drosophila grimshawi]EDW01339.1 GH20510 [Drosophila grimshawi]
MYREMLALCLLAVVCTTGVYGSCKATVNAFSTQDATILTQVAHVAEFSLQCSNSAQPSLFAEFPCGKVVPVAKVGDNKYQVSWVEDIKGGSSGNVQVRLFDEDGYANVRKAQRDGDKVSSVKSLLDIGVPTKGAYKGPWIKAEILAAILVGGVAYFAFTTKGKVQS